MSVLFYTQHVLGMGHLFRSLAVAEALGPEPVHLITGGAEAPAALPAHVHHLPLPPLMMDADFSRLHLGDADSAAEIDPARREALVTARFTERTDRLRRALAEIRPDLLLVELYPFGRKRFGREILPLLEDARAAGVPVVCSLRDILVEKKDQDAFERRVLETLHRHFSALLIHSDPALFPLEATFQRAGEIAVPLAYSGYVAPPAVDGTALRQSLHLAPGEALLLASIGGGAVGLELMRAVLQASRLLHPARPHRLLAFAGPFMAEADFRSLQRLTENAPWIVLERFSARFQELLAAADGSVSLAGYNTVMGLLVQGVPGLVLPFDQNREQRLRAEALARRGLLELLTPQELEPALLAARLDSLLHTGRRSRSKDIDLDGAAASARILRQWRERWRR
ncbi:glycosyltransferase family protein [Megalodesulfovibrio gigas]|uniref:Putative glycosyltransferase 28 domain protein n=1 Tax=Megalodesulfovibrio gigas (strain ATCC 19364 / DSM 1382 / NCIMB 9332 / VKM B-1759) TaxID=1121448 RepID=T2GCS8_MEGG1|nr:glycosyltransferase [Megalodesulfovibrio gigas]AGW13984.1 putative glycosyltransferase 28 domain protein [Megalodesulfovibrio gigas DSM 1382 = ATCC 19364]